MKDNTMIDAKDMQEKMALWEKTGLLKGLSDDKKLAVSILMENQRVLNESHDDQSVKRFNIPLVRRWVGNTVLFDLVSVQALTEANSEIYHFSKNTLISSEVKTTPRKMKTSWSLEATQSLRSCNGIDAEMDLLSIIAAELTLEVDRSVISEMRINAALHKKINFKYLSGTYQEKNEIVKQQIYNVGKESSEMYGRSFPNWMICSPEMRESVGNNTSKKTRSWNLGVRKEGVFEFEDATINIYSDPLFPVGTVLLGYKGEHVCDSGYVFAPHLMVQASPVVLDPDDFVPRRQLLSQFSGNLINPTYYSTLEVKDFLA
jgi:hypothetical protein